MANLGTFSGMCKARLIDAGGSRHFVASTDLAVDPLLAPVNKSFELAALAAISIRYALGVSGVPTSLAPTAAQVDVFEESSGTVVQSYPVTDPAVGQTFSFTAPRFGTYRIREQVSRIEGLPSDWRINSDNTSTLYAAGQSHDWAAGYLRAGTTIASLLFSAIALGGAAPTANRFAYPQSQFIRTTFGHQALAQTRSITLSQRQAGVQKSTDTATAGTANPCVLDVTRTGGVGAASGINNAFLAADTATVVRLRFGDSALSSQPWCHLTAVPAGWTGTAGTLGTGLVQADSAGTDYTIDLRLTQVPLFQVNSDAFATPPLSTDLPAHQRQVTETGFLAERFVNVNGDGISGLTYDAVLTPVLPGTAVTVTGRTTGPQGGQAGWASAFLSWISGLPGGTWNKSLTITAPAQIVGASYLLGFPDAYVLLATDPNFVPILAVDTAASGSEDHWHAGDELKITFRVFSKATRKNILLDALPVPTCVLLRHNTPTGVDEYLDAAFAWVGLEASGPAFEHAFGVSSDPKVRVLVFTSAQTAAWGSTDLLAVVATGYSNGTPYSDHGDREAVGNKNGHKRNAFDPTGLFK